MLIDKIEKKNKPRKGCQPFSNLWPELLDQKHHIWKYHESQSPSNETL